MAKKTLKDYLLGIKKEHVYTIRIALEEIPEKDMTRIENNLKAYELIKVGKPKSTIWQKQPLGFAEPVNSKITIFDVTTGIPASSFYLAREIAKILKISEIHVVVNGLDNPIPGMVETPNFDGHIDGYVSKVSTDPAYPEDKGLPANTELVGQKYIDGMLDTIAKAKKKDPNSVVSTPSKKK